MAKRNEGRSIILSKSKGKSVLGFDVSSKTVGWGLISNDGLHAYGHIRPLPSKFSLLERLNDLFDKINLLCVELSPSIISIEDITLFMRNKSTAKTITTLATFNRLVAISAYRVVKDVKFYHVATIRRIIKESIGVHQKIMKEDIPQLIQEFLEPKFSDVIKRGGGRAVQTYDEADGIAVAWACVKDIL